MALVLKRAVLRKTVMLKDGRMCQKYPGMQRQRIWSAPNWSGWLPAGISTNRVEILEQSRAAIAAPSGTPRFVAVEQQNNFFEVVLKEPLLMLGKGASHEGSDAMQTCLTDGEAIEEAFRQSRFACLTILLTRLSDILQSFGADPQTRPGVKYR